MEERRANMVAWPCMSPGFMEERTEVCFCITCVPPAPPPGRAGGTPDGEDTPGANSNATPVFAGDTVVIQLDFSTEVVANSPNKTVFTHDPVSGMTPLGATANQQATLRVEMEHAGVPGHRFESPINPATPARGN